MFKGEFLLKTNELSNIQIITVLAVIFLLMFIIYKTVTINQKRKIVPFQKNRKISPSRAARKSPKVKVTHNTSVFNFTNDSKDDIFNPVGMRSVVKKNNVVYKFYLLLHYFQLPTFFNYSVSPFRFIL